MMDNAIWGMILGKSGKLPGELAPEIVALAKEKGYEFSTEDPQTNYPDELDRFIKEMEENGWDRGQDDEELLEFAMHETQYRDYKSGAAKKRFLADLQAAKDKSAASGLTPEEAAALKHAKADAIVAPESGIVLWEIGGDAESVKSIEPFMEKSTTRAISSATSRTASARFWKSPQHWVANWWKSMPNRVATCRRAM